MEKKAKIDFDKTFKNYSSKEGISFREEYLNKFLEKGFPNRQMENWKFLDLQQIINNNIGELNFYNDFNKENDLKKIEFIKEFEHNKIIFINYLVKIREFPIFFFSIWKTFVYKII